MGIQPSFAFVATALATSAFLVTGATVSPASVTPSASHSTLADRQLAVVASPLPIPSTSYPIPTGALFVSPSGYDTNDGSVTQPLRSLTRAIAVAPANATIVMRAGVYRETFGNVVRPVTIQPYPNEQVWLSGSDVVTNWSPVPNGWVHHNWTTQFCRTCFAAGAVDVTNYPLAAWPDQVFFNGVPVTQVADLAHLSANTFYVDYASADLYVGSDPSVPTTIVEASTRVSAGSFRPTAIGSVVRGIGVMRYAPNWNENAITGEIEDHAANMIFEGDVFTQSANRGLFVNGAAHVTVTDSAFVSNGFTGLYVRGGNYFDMERNLVDNNNTEKFWDGYSTAAGAAGTKISASFHVTVKGNIATNNYGNGIWSDVSSYDVNIVDNFAARNSRNGFYVEITGTSVVASNVSILNGQGGLKLSGATSSRVYNNTFVDNATYQISVHDDGRNQPDPVKAALGITWNTANNTFVNNILAAASTGSVGPLVFTQNNDIPVIVEATKMITGMDYDLFTRPTATLPSLLAWWIHAAPQPTSTYATMAAFKGATAYETHGIEINGYTTSPIFTAPQLGDFTPLPGGPASLTGSPLPSDIASLIGVSAGVAVDRGALTYPGSASLPTVYVSDTFSRVVNGGWGVATNGPAWSVSPATSQWAVNGSAGTVTGPAGQNAIAGIAPVRTTDADMSISCSATALANAQPMISLVVRNIDAKHQYQSRLRVASSGAMFMAIARVVGTAYTLVGPEVLVPGITWAPGKVFRIRTQAVGTSPATVRVKVWLEGSPEPAAWNVAQTDTDPTLQLPGSFGIVAIARSGIAGSLNTFTFDDLAISST